MAKKNVYKDFEGALARLEEIVNALDSGELTLEESIALYTEGVEVAAVCNGKLTEAEGKIAKLTKMTDSFALESMTGVDNE